MDSKCICFLLAALVTYASSAEDKEEICRLFLNNNGIKHHLSSSDVAATACPCVETKVALDYSFKKINNCYQEWFYNDHGWKQMCCYSDNGEILTGAPLGGYLSVKSYSENISKAHEACCHGNNRRCKLFYDINPSDDCSRYNQPDIVKSWGDPTITTTDKFVYDFNGHGEYWFLITGDVEIQARTEYVTMGNTDATMFTAFVIYNSALKEQVELHLNRSSKLISVYRHGVHLGDSSKPNLYPLSPPNPNECFLQAGAKKVVVLNCGLQTFCRSVTFSATDFMSVGISMISGKSETLTFTGLAEPRISGELILEDGSTVSENASAATLFDFGASWALEKESDSRFNYSITAGKNFTSFNSNHTRPRFLEELVGNLTALFPNSTHADIDKYNTTCRNYWNNEPNKQCLLTIARTGDYSLGVAIMKTANETQLLLERKHNHRPNFNANMLNKLKVVLTEYSRPYTINLTKYVNDSDSNEVFRFTVETEIPQSDYELGDGEFQWTIKKSLRNITTSLDISFHVFDKFNTTSSHTLQIDFCGCEHGNNECDFTEKNNAAGIIAKCKCDKAYNGDFCEKTVDPCLVNNCYLDHCNHSAAVGEDPCKPCPDGYQGDGRECTDVDECDESYHGTDKCKQKCTNTEGSFTCGCLLTYKLNDDNYTCSDIDECINETLSCSGNELCVNTIGSAHCACVPGYIRKTSNGSCESIKDTLQYAGSIIFSITTDNKLTVVSEVNTLENREAINEEMDNWYKGTKNYVAVEVYMLQVSNSSRRKRDAGSGSAKLEVDFIIYGSNGTAKEIGAAIETSYTNYKTNHSNFETVITVAGAQISLHPGVVSMRSPNEFGMCNITNRTDCDTTTTVCKNTDGGFTCHCLPGYEKNTTSTNKCFDIDECKLFIANNTSEQRCVQGTCKNEVGTWTCVCQSDLESQRVGVASYPVYRCQGNYSYIGNASMLVRGTTNDTDIISIIERYLTDSYRNQSFEGKTFTVPISNLLVSPTVLTLRKEYNYTNGTMGYIAMFKLRMGEVVEVQRVADVLLKAVEANAIITGHSFNATILTNHIYTDEENMLCTLSNNSDCDVSTTTCQQGNGSTSCQCLVGYERKDYTHCTVKDCGSLSNPDNGLVELTNNQTIFNSTATFECNEGYNLEGDRGSMCTSSGHWSSNASCLIWDCGNLTVENGEVTLVNNQTTFNASANIQCHIGYDIIGITRSVCNDSGHWTVEPICKITDCGPLEVTNGIVSLDGDRTTYNTVANISCETGFDCFGDSQIVCNTTGYWSGEANCTIKDCGNLTVENGEVTLVDNRTTFNASANIHCHIGYNIIGNTSVCNGSGHWTVEPICEIKDCGILTKPMKGTVESDGNSTTYLSTANFSCDEGFYLSEEGFSTCSSDGNWTHMPTCEIYDCRNLTVENGEVTLVNNRTTFNASANIQCHIGYDIIGKTLSVCNASGHWTVEPICNITDCGPLEVTNGTISLDSDRTTYNTTANISCKTGFDLFGDSQIVCNATGHWSGEANCSIKDCGVLSNPVHGRVVIANNVSTYQSTANFTCDEGYYLDGGDEISICGSNGTWTREPTCILHNCGNLTIKEHGTVHLTNNLTTFNSSATFSCDIGYELTTINYSECNSSGNWTNKPQCEIRDCGELDVYHASKVNITTYGSTVTFTCLPGYDLNGTRNATCDQSGLWTALPTCVAKDCGNITALPNGDVSLSNSTTTYGSQAVFKCDKGYTLTTVTPSVCNSSGQWTHTPSCQILDCGNLTIKEHGTVYLTSNLTTFSSSATFECDIGYNLTTDNRSFCNSSGKWSNEPQCEIRDCGELDVYHASKVNITTYGSTVTFTCLPGYDLNGTRNATCDQSGQWTALPTCVAKDCGNITALANGDVSLSNSTTTYGSQAVFKCDKGYTLTTVTPSVCNSSGQWTHTPSCQILDCQALDDPQNGNVFLANDTTTYRSMARYVCFPGYSLSGNNIVHCNSSGNWSNIRTCNIKDCEKITAPANGNVYLSNSRTTYGSQAMFTCEEGYTLTNNTPSVCNSSGQWTHTPSCQIRDCGNLTIKEHGTVYLTNNLTTFSSSATFECDIGYNLTTDNRSFCNSSGKWSNEPQCEIRDCGELDVYHASKVNITTYGSTVTFTCLPGYDLNGTRNATCDQSGQWTALPTCVAKDCGNITALPNGDVSLSNSTTTYGSQAVFKCDKGYTLTTVTPSVCNSSGQWTHTPSCQILDCQGLDDPQNGNVFLDNDTTTYRSMARYVCFPGYSLSGNNIVHCNSSGNWSNIRTCNIKDCGDWSNDTRNKKNNIVVKYDNNRTYYLSTATADCRPGYHVDGLDKTQVIAVCQANATWSKRIPMCVDAVCKAVNHTSGVEVNYSASEHHSFTTTATFYCSDKYKYYINGFEKLTCLSSGKWDHVAPTCEKVDGSINKCEKEKDDDYIVWGETHQGITLKQECGTGYEGSITRKCLSSGTWERPIDHCVKKAINSIINQVDAYTDIPIDSNRVSSIFDQLEDITEVPEPLEQSDTNKLNGNDLTKVTSVLNTLVTKLENHTVTKNQSQSLLNATSNMLDVRNSEAWSKASSSPDSTQKEAAAELLDVVTQYSKLFANSLNATTNSSTIKAKNLVMHVRKLSGAEDVKFQPEEHAASSVSIPKESLKGLANTDMSIVIYKNLRGILSKSAVQNGTVYTEINSQVMAVDIKGWQNNPDFKLNMTFNHFNQTSKTAGIPHCSFFADKDNSRWNTTGCTLVKSVSNSNTSVCECQHLTNFAILMSPWIPPSDAEALDIISIIGCSLSLLGLLVTMIMHLALWRYLKSDRVVILMNLCLALIISYAIFLGGVDQTQNKDACTVVAVLLQYIYLVVFFLMLAEAIELAVTVLYVFSTASRLKWLVPLAWFLPAMITGVSVGSSQLEGYGNEQFCWLSVEDGLIWAFVAPAFTIIIVNFVLLVLVMKAMFNAQTLVQKSLSQRTKTGVRCLCVLLPLMGITWVIGIFYVNEETVWIQYVFAFCNSLQGLIIFIFHCALNTQIRRAVRRKHKQYTDSMQISKPPTFSLPRVGIRNSQHNMVYNDMTEIEPDYDYDWRISAHDRNSSRSRESYGEWITPKSSVL